MLNRLMTFALMLAVWLVFSGMFDVFHVTLGVVSAAFVALISSDLLFEDKTAGLGARIRQGWRLAWYFLWMLWQIGLANLHLLRLALWPGGRADIHPQIVRYRTTLESDFEKFLLANSITLTPGTVTLKILGDDFFIHAISRKSALGLGAEMERRIRRVFATAGGDRPRGTEGAA